MKRSLALFVSANLLLLAGTIVFLFGEEESPWPVVPEPAEVAGDKESSPPVVTAPAQVAAIERPVVLHALPESEAPGEAELEEELRKAVEGADWRRVVELQDKLAELRRERNEEVLREMRNARAGRWSGPRTANLRGR